MTAYNVVDRALMASGQPEDITRVLANFDAIAAVLNGNLDGTNISAVPPSKITGYPADATKVLKGDGTWGSSASPIARVRHSANVTIANAAGGGTTLPWDVEDFDTDTIHDNVTNNTRLTCKTAGKYLVNARLDLSNAIANNDTAELRKNGVAFAHYIEGSTGLFILFTSLVDLVVNDYLEVWIVNNTGGLRQSQAGAARSYFEMVKVA